MLLYPLEQGTWANNHHVYCKYLSSYTYKQAMNNWKMKHCDRNVQTMLFNKNMLILKYRNSLISIFTHIINNNALNCIRTYVRCFEGHNCR